MLPHDAVRTCKEPRIKYEAYEFDSVLICQRGQEGGDGKTALAHTYLVGDCSDSLSQADRRLAELVVFNVGKQKLVQLLAHLDLASHGDMSAVGVHLCRRRGVCE